MSIGVIRAMRTTWLFRVLRVVAGVATLAFVLTPSAVLADCMMPAPVQEAAKSSDIVFVGTVAETSNQNRWASVTVEEIWRGPDLGSTVVVKGGSGGNGISSVDRSYQAGVKYLFFPYAGEEGDLADNVCTNTVEWTADLAQLRPGDARQALPADDGQGTFDAVSLVAPLGVAILVGGALLVAGLLARGRTA
jgi:hypothetical protein